MADEKRHMHRSWVDLEAHYKTASSYAPQFSKTLEAMAQLCSCIGSSELADGLFGHTSMHTLLISQIATTYPPHDSIQWLVIEPILGSGEVEFRFEDTPRSERQWRRVETPEGLLDRFNGFLMQVGWAYNPIAASPP